MANKTIFKNFSWKNLSLSFSLSIFFHLSILAILFFSPVFIAEKQASLSAPEIGVIFKQSSSDNAFHENDASFIRKNPEPKKPKISKTKTEVKTKKNLVQAKTKEQDHDVSNEQTSSSSPGTGQALAENSNEKSGKGDIRGFGAARSKPVLISDHKVEKKYPLEARVRGVEGTVRLSLTVLESGQVADVEVLSGPAYGLRQAAIALARKLFFLPARDQNGRAQIAKIKHEVVFRLKNS